MDTRVARAEGVLKVVVGGGTAAVEKPSLRHDERTRTDTGDCAACSMMRCDAGEQIIVERVCRSCKTGNDQQIIRRKARPVGAHIHW